MPFLASEGCFWPPTASMTSEVKNNCAYVITQDICNNFIEVNFCVGFKGFTAKLSIAPLNICQILMRFFLFLKASNGKDSSKIWR